MGIQIYRQKGDNFQYWIGYLIQYGRIQKRGENGTLFVSLDELKNYYSSLKKTRENNWKQKLGEDLNWALSFEEYKEAETTKHVHHLHPYKGKFIPQLVEYFLDSHTDNFKKEVFFKKGEIVLDPFCGSGTTLVQANELGIHAIVIDISEFNSFISNCKLGRYDLVKLQKRIEEITKKFKQNIQNPKILDFDEELTQYLTKFNTLYFPVPDYKYKLRKKEIIEEEYAINKEKTFLELYWKLIKDHDIQLCQENNKKFLEK